MAYENARLSDSMVYRGNAWKHQKNIYNRAQEELDRWQLQTDYVNEYNSPVNQLQRLYDANINPLYGSEFSHPSSEFGLSQIPTAQSPFEMFGQVGKQMNDLFSTSTQRDLANSQIELNQSAGALNRASARKAGSESTLNEIRSKTEFDTRLAELHNLVKQGNLTDAQRDKLRTDMYQSWQYLANDLQNTESSFIQAVSQYRNSSVNMYGAVTDRMNAQTNQFNAQTMRKSYLLDVDKFDQAVRQQDWNMVSDIIDKATSKTLLGNFSSEDGINTMSHVMRTLHNYIQNNDFTSRIDFNNAPVRGHYGAGHDVYSGVNDAINQGYFDAMQKISNIESKMQTFGNTVVNKLKNEVIHGTDTLYLDEFGQRRSDDGKLMFDE